MTDFEELNRFIVLADNTTHIRARPGAGTGQIDVD